MVTFVNRQTEMMLIDDALKALQNYENDSLLRTPIIDFFGIEGIGKTAILKHIKEQCKKQQIRYILINADQNASHFSYEIVRQTAERYNIRPPDGSEDPFQQSLSVIEAWLQEGTAVLILDNVDAGNEELVERIAITLRDVIDDKKLFVVLASKRGILFDSERSVARKLTSLQLKPLDPKSCEDYLDEIEPPLEKDTRQYISDWTRGYPLAMEVMITAVTKQKLNPTLPEDQKTLVNLIVERVIDQKVFARLAGAERSKYKELFMILSVPRYFNLRIMQGLIERFIPEQKERSGLAYMKLPGSIRSDTDILNWNIFKSGFTIDAPIRNVFLLKIRLEQPERYTDIHQFLAELNEKFADEVEDSDRIRYFCEYLYHSAYVKSELEFIQILEQVQKKISNKPFPSLETFEAFETSFEELLQDNDFRDVLDERIATVQSLIYKYLAEVSKQEAERITSGEEHFYHLRKFFIYIAKDPKITDLRSAWIPALRDIIAKEPSDSTEYFVKELLNTEKLKEALGNHFPLLAELISQIS